MEILNTLKKKERLKRKGFDLLGEEDVLDRYSYYQLVNGYKFLFVKKVFGMHDLTSELKSKGSDKLQILDNLGVEDTDQAIKELYLAVNRKYSLNFNERKLKNDDPETLEIFHRRIDDLDFKMHIYTHEKNGTILNDVHISSFIKVLKFEHELRGILLRYCLMIEEVIKREFINYLNDTNKESNFLQNYSTYNSKDKYSEKNFIKIKEMISDRRNLTIRKKVEQNVEPPFWIIIHAMQLNVAINTIKNINKEDSDRIKFRLLKNLTSKKSKIYDKIMNLETGKEVKFYKKANSFFDILHDIGKFRNLLAHNQPLYNFNVENTEYFPSLKVYHFGKRNKHEISNKINILEEYTNINHFDPSNRNVKNLAFIIYAITAIVQGIDDDTKCSYDIYKCFEKHGMINKKVIGSVRSKSMSPTDMTLLVDKIENNTLNSSHSDQIDAMISVLKSVKSSLCTKTYEYLGSYYLFTGLNDTFMLNLELKSKTN